MFSSIFGKRRSSPVEDENPPIPGAIADGFVVVNPTPSPPSRGLYPNVSGGSSPYQRPAPPTPVAPKPLIDPTFHYLQGVPFRMSKELQLASRKDSIASEISNIIAMSKVNLSGYNYDFSIEKSVLNEYGV